ncbi:universal stress protein [Inquilinus sp. CAU 1745]|uniref:universal stress protein n=1 Tax=Inquilinus sp. CAU 1745 TaxID=3140369 RepID=UPI00325B40FF
MFKHILSAVDGSNHSWRGAEMAVDLAITFQAKITLLHVARKFPVPERLREYLKTEHLTGEALYDIDEATEKVVNEVCAAAEKRGLKQVRTAFKEGKPSLTIVSYAQRNGVDAIVMGARGLTDIEGHMLGSVSYKVASLSPCTVIIAK